MNITFEETSFGPGALVRFKSMKSHVWTYAIYRGVEGDEGRAGRAYVFSDQPLGAITRWLKYWPPFIQAAVPVGAKQ